MKQEHNQLDDFLHDQVENAQFDFKEAYWDKMEVLLDEEQKEKKKPLFWRGLSIFVVALIVSAGAYILPKLKQTESTNSAPTIVQSQAVEPVNTDQQNIENWQANRNRLIQACADIPLIHTAIVNWHPNAVPGVLVPSQTDWARDRFHYGPNTHRQFATSLLGVV